MINPEKCIRQGIASCPMFTNTFLDFVMQTIHRSLKWSAIALGGCLLSSTIAAPARADLFSTALNTDDTLVTRDTRTGLEWLDLSVSQNLTYQQVLNGEKDLTTKLGFRYASLSEVQDLIKSADTYTRSQSDFIPMTEDDRGSYATRAITKFLDVPLLDSYSDIKIYAATPMFGPANPITNRASVYALSYYSRGNTSSTFPFPLNSFADIVDTNTGEVFLGGPYVGPSSLLVRSTNPIIPPTQKTPEPTTGLALLLTSGLAAIGYKKRQSQFAK
jgi:hypothetical protein